MPRRRGAGRRRFDNRSLRPGTGSTAHRNEKATPERHVAFRFTGGGGNPSGRIAVGQNCQDPYAFRASVGEHREETGMGVPRAGLLLSRAKTKDPGTVQNSPGTETEFCTELSVWVKPRNNPHHSGVSMGQDQGRQRNQRDRACPAGLPMDRVPGGGFTQIAIPRVPFHTPNWHDGPTQVTALDITAWEDIPSSTEVTQLIELLRTFCPR